jgi:voltage-gated sodium channel type IV alpha
LDFAVVILAFISLDPSVGNLSAMRAFRVFRALKSITIVPGLKTMVKALGACLYRVIHPVILIVFTVILFALFGIHLYSGKLRQKCMCMPGLELGWTDEAFVAWVEDPTYYLEDGLYHCGNATGARHCPDTHPVCDAVQASNATYNVSIECITAGPNPNLGYTSFDNFGWASLTAFQLLTADWWENVYDATLMATGPVSVLYFLFIIFLGSFFVINLVLAVVEDAFDDVSDVEEARAREKVAAEQAEAAAAAAAATASGHGSPDDESVKTLDDHSAASTATAARASAAAATAGAGGSSSGTTAYNIKAGGGESADVEGGVRGEAPPRARRGLVWLVETDAFVAAVIIAIGLNTLTMAMWSPRLSSSFERALDGLNYVFTGLFLVEMVLKQAAYGIGGYFTHKWTPADHPNRSSSVWNRFDAVIVLVSVIEVAILAAGGDGVGGLSVLRTFRLLRVLKLGQSWPLMHKLITTIGSSVDDLSYLTLVLLIVSYTFAAMGFQLYKDDYLELSPDEIPRWNFTDFKHSLMMVFRVLCGEWIEPLYDSMLISGYTSVLFFLVTLGVGNFVILNLFLALLLKAFDDEQEEEALAKEQAEEAGEPLKDEPAGRPGWFARLDVWCSRGIRGEPPAAAANKVGPSHGAVVAGVPGGGGGVGVGGGGEADAPGEFVLSDPNTQQVTDLFCCFNRRVDAQMYPFRAKMKNVLVGNKVESFVMLMILWSSIMLAFEDRNFRDNAALERIVTSMNVAGANRNPSQPRPL